MGKQESKKIDYIKWIFMLMLLGVGLYFVFGQLFLPKDVPDNAYNCETFPADWVRVKSDGTRVPVDVPGKCEAKRNEAVVIETTLPEDVENNTYLCFRSSKQDMQIYVDGKLRQEYSTEHTRLFGRTSAVAYVFLPLYDEDAEKTVTVVTRTDSSYSGIFYTVYYGDKMGIWHKFSNQYGAELVTAFFTLLLGIITIIGSIAMRLFYHRRIELEYLGWGVFLAAVWLIMNSAFRQLLFPSISVVSDMAFYMIMLIPIPILMYMDETQNRRYHRLYMFAEGLDILNFAVCTILHDTNTKDFADTIIYMALVCFLSILCIGITVILDIKGRHIRDYILAAIGLLGVCLAAVVQIVIYFQRTIPFNGIVMSAGLVFLLVTAIINTIHNILHMEREKQQAIAASEAKAKFLANMSHEIRTPINAVLGMDAMILRESEDIQIKEYALDIQNAGQTLLALINDILDMSKIESGKMEIIPVEYDLSSMIHDIVNMISMKAKDKELSLHMTVNQELPSRLFGDEIRIRQVLVNILNNAIKYTEEGSVTFVVDGSVEKDTETDADTNANADTVILHFSVEDTGIGIREEDISKLFAEFERIEEKRNRKIEGTGLGMNITARLLDMMGTTLDVKSVYGEGSAFSFDLEQRIVNREPIGNLEERIRQQTMAHTYHVSFTAPEAELLVVDDNMVNRRVFINLLKATKVKIDEADSGKECLEKAFAKHYDLIFLDHMMPDMDGVETLHYLKDKADYPCADTPVIVLTANAISGAKEMYLSEGFDAFLSKPIIPEKLEQMIREMLPHELVCYEPIKEEQRKTEQNTSVGMAREEIRSTDNLPDIDGIDWSYGLMHLTDADVLMDTVRDFYKMLDTDADYLEECYNKGIDDKNGLNLYRIKVHAMKSSAALIGAIPLSGMAKVLEYAARDGISDTIKSLTPIFLREWRGYKDKLRILFAEEHGEKQKEMAEDYSVTLAYLELLRSAMDDLDIDELDHIMDELTSYRYPPDMQPEMDSLADAVINLDSDGTYALIEKLGKSIKDKL